MSSTQQLTGFDRSMLLMETPTHPLVVLGGIVVKGTIDKRKFSSVVRATIKKPKWRLLRSVITHANNCKTIPATPDMAEPVFQELTNFDATQNILFEPETTSSSEQEDDWTNKYLSHLQSLPTFDLNDGRPLWRIHVARNRGEKKSIIGLRVHHSVLDGFSGGRFISEIIDGVKENPLLTAKKFDNGPAKTPWRIFCEWVAYIFWFCIVIGKMTILSLTSPKPPDFLICKSKTAAKEVRCDSTAITLSELNTLRKKVGATINDFYLTVTARIVLRLLKKYSKTEFTSNWLPIMVPVDLRMAKGNLGFIGNNVGTIAVKLPMNEDLSFIESLMNIKSQMDFSKKSPEALIMQYVMDWICSLPSYLCVPLSRLAVKNYSLAYSNVRWSSGKGLNICGCEVLDICPFLVPPNPMTLTFIVSTWNEKVGYSVCVDEGLLGEDGSKIVLQEYRKAIEVAKREIDSL